MSSQNLVSVAWLQEHLHDPNLVIADCRFTLGNPGQGLSEYVNSHIPGAFYFDLQQDLSAAKDVHGGRHPLASVETLEKLFAGAGIDETTTVVAYDAQDMAYAARLWWTLRYLGHQRVYVLDGGFAAWQAAGLPVTDEVPPQPTSRTFRATPQPQMLVNLEDIRATKGTAALLDSRAGERYRGEMETLDPKAGHIPGAKHFFYKENIQADGTLRSAEELQQRFAPLAEKEEIIVYCGSGVTACVNILALYEAGRTDAKLYVGSWSDYCSYDLPVATGDKDE